MPLRPRSEIKNLKVCTHGGINLKELGKMQISPQEVLDFSVCLNPFMPPPEINKIRLSSCAINQYPDSKATEFVKRLSEKLDVLSDNLLAGSGTTELIRLVAFGYFKRGDNVLIIEPTYGEYEVAVTITGAKPLKQWMKEEDNFALRIDDALNLIRQRKPSAAFICNPNNPTGQYLCRRDIEALLTAIGDGLLILDEAYINFVDKSWSSVDLISRGNVIILRSMTKDYAIAGLRLGYVIASAEIIRNLIKVCPPWNVNAVAQKVGIMLLENSSYLERSKPNIGKAKKLLVDELSKLSFKVIPSDAHYFLVKVGDAKSFRNTLLSSGIQVRDCTSFGLPGYIRISARTRPECRKLIDAISKLKIKSKLDHIKDTKEDV